ncbi:dihydroorotase [Candidatus Pelagibacter sp.]|nr:dihydroorotase [Candidatus Pelagibacter sp.]
MLDLIVRNGTCFIDGNLSKYDIGVQNGKITHIGDLTKEQSSNTINVDGKIVFPGLMDTQVHFREPGSVDAEDLHSGSRAAIVGGITSVFEMPNTNPPTTNFEEFQKKINIGKRMYCNHAFYFGATAENYEILEKLKNLEGCCGIKLFAGSSTGNLLVDKEEDIEKVFKYASKVVAVHSEDEEILKLRKKLIQKGDVKTHPVWRNEEVAISSTRKIVKIAKRLNKKAHILHVTTKDEVDFLSQNKGNITFEITPQHLTMYAPDCYDRLGSYAQMNPPIRDKSHYDRLWYAIRNDYNDTIGSDHAPHLKINKEKQYPDSPSGMPGVQTILPVMLNHMNDGKIKLNQIVKFLCENPVKIFGIKNKGYIKKDFDADFTIVDLNKVIKIKNENIESKCGWSPFDGYKFKGTPIYTIIAGEIKMQDGKVIGEPTGKPLSFK